MMDRQGQQIAVGDLALVLDFEDVHQLGIEPADRMGPSVLGMAELCRKQAGYGSWISRDAGIAWTNQNF